MKTLASGAWERWKTALADLPIRGARAPQARRTAVPAALFGAAALGACLFLAACEPSDGPRGAVLTDIRTRGALRVATLDAPTTYYLGREGPAGFEYDLAHAYADHLGVEVEVVVRDTLAGVIAAVDAGEADIAAAGLARTAAGESARRFSPIYMKAPVKVVCRRGGPNPKDTLGLSRVKLALAEGSSHTATLDALQTQEAKLSWRELPGANREDALEAVSAGEIDCTLVDGPVYALTRRYLPSLRAAFDMPEETPFAWALAGERTWRNVTLERDLKRWFRRAETRRAIEILEEKYFGFAPQDVDAAHSAAFRRAIDRSLPKYETLFQDEGARAEVPWTLLAAVAYQESHWNPNAKSPTGVRGMMMLTQATAKELGVANRLDTLSSTRGGAKYLRALHDRLPDTIVDDERWWFAAAAYNIGWGHLADARDLAAELGLEADRWADVRQVLPLLEDPFYYKGLRYGFARGTEAQTYVQRIRDYADVLEKRFAPPPPEATTTKAELATEPEPKG